MLDKIVASVQAPRNIVMCVHTYVCNCVYVYIIYIYIYVSMYIRMNLLSLVCA